MEAKLKVSARRLFKKTTQYVWLNVLLITLLGIPILLLLIVIIARLLFWCFLGISKEHLLMIVNTNNYTFDLKDIVYFSVTLIGVVATSVFSYFIWKANKKSAEISEKLADLEISRDTAAIKESATLLYFTALSGLEYLFDEYHHKKNIQIPHLSIKWIDNLDRLYGHLSIEEIKLFFDFYNVLNEVSNISGQIRKSPSLKSGDKFSADYPNQLKEKIDFCIGTYFDSSCIEYSWIEYGLEKPEFITPINLLKKEYKAIFDKLNKLIHFGKIDESNEYLRKEWYKTGTMFCEIRYSSDQILHKKFWSADGELLEDCDYIDGKASGYKEIYEGNNLIFVGQIKDNKKYTGKEYKVLLRDSDDYDLLRDEAFIEQQMKEQSTDEYWENQATQIADQLEDGTQGWAEYCQAEWINGKRILLKDKVYREPI